MTSDPFAKLPTEIRLMIVHLLHDEGPRVIKFSLQGVRLTHWEIDRTAVSSPITPPITLRICREIRTRAFKRLSTLPYPIMICTSTTHDIIKLISNAQSPCRDIPLRDSEMVKNMELYHCYSDDENVHYQAQHALCPSLKSIRPDTRRCVQGYGYTKNDLDN